MKMSLPMYELCEIMPHHLINTLFAIDNDNLKRWNLVPIFSTQLKITP